MIFSAENNFVIILNKNAAKIELDFFHNHGLKPMAIKFRPYRPYSVSRKNVQGDIEKVLYRRVYIIAV